MGWPTRRQKQRQVKLSNGPILWSQLTQVIRSDIQEYLSVFEHNGVSISTDPKSEDPLRRDLNVFVTDTSAAPSPPRTANILFVFDPVKAAITATVATMPEHRDTQYLWKIVSDQEGADAGLMGMPVGQAAPQWVSKEMLTETRVTPESISEEVLATWLP